MAIYRLTEDAFVPVDETTFAAAGLRERNDIQRRIRVDISILAPDVMVVAEEFADWSDSSRRIDLLCIDRDANLVVVELKRTEDAGHSDLQALRYAAMVSSMTFQQVVEAHSRYKRLDDVREAEAAILAFLGWTEPMDEEFGKDVRIVLAAADFGREVTTTVLWLNERGIDIRCVRLKPYRLSDGTILVDAQQIIPLPEASEYVTKLADKREEERNGPRNRLREEFWAGVLKFAQAKNAPNANRSPTKRSWIGKSSGLSLNYAIREYDGQVEIYIDRGDEKDNLRSLEYLHTRQGAIEQITGPLLWDALPDSRACRISLVLPGGWKSPKSDWSGIQERMIHAALLMDEAFRDLLAPAAHV
ncbi:DUF4268 domain-containing protein [Azospirillum melinis]|uniref:DUF4268 domain-containing protein n=1 Tax=Azospirillum melinis TaxID=328839 RepID=UPI003757CBE9